MLTVAEALDAVLRHAGPLPAHRVRLEESLGWTLAEEISADIDLPPFDKSLMDGFAVRSADLATPGEHRLRVVEEILAGTTPTRSLIAGEAAQIMTGAPLPSGSDAVVMIERSTLNDDGTVVIQGPISPGLNRLPRGREMRSGEVLLRIGTRLDATRLGLIASAGRSEILIVPGPSVAVIPTGDELVPMTARPQAAQIRNSNGIMLAGLARASGARIVREMPIAPDEPNGLRSALATALEGADVLLVSGGVSQGTRDLVPAALIELGIEPVFHKVRVKPGKPLWFGVGPRRANGSGAMVFGLPGNPASGVVGFLLFVRPALDALAGRSPSRPPLTTERLGVPFEHRGDRPTYHPARLEGGRILPIDWAGSADLRGVALADGFAAFPAGDRSYQSGEELPFLHLD